MDERLRVLLLQRSVRCNIRKSPYPIPFWFKEAFDMYNGLYMRPDKDSNLVVKGILNDLFTLIKYVALPNQTNLRLKMIEKRWASLQARVAAL